MLKDVILVALSMFLIIGMMVVFNFVLGKEYNKIFVLIYVILAMTYMFMLTIEIYKISQIVRHKYSVSEHILIRKETKEYFNPKGDDNLLYFFIFDNFARLVPTNKKDYDKYGVGDKFYLVAINKSIYTFGCDEYELDESIKYKLN